MRSPGVRHRSTPARLAILAGALALLAPAGAPAEVPGPAPETPSAPRPSAGQPGLEPGAPEGVAAPPLELTIQPGSTVSYHLVHTIHDVVGVTRKVEGGARLSPAGEVAVSVRARVDGFDSGNGSRDAKMLEVTDAARFPFVILEARGTLDPPARFPATVGVGLTGELDFHGVRRPVSVPVRVTFTGPTTATATASFPISLREFGVKPPSLLFLVIQDRAVITAAVALSATPP